MLINSIYLGKTPISLIYKSGKIIWRSGEELYFSTKQLNISSFKYAIITKAAADLIYLNYKIALEKQNKLELEEAKIGIIKNYIPIMPNLNLEFQETIPIIANDQLFINLPYTFQFSLSKNMLSQIKNNLIFESNLIFSESQRVKIQENNKIYLDSYLRFSKSIRIKAEDYNLIGHMVNVDSSPSKRIIIIAKGIIYFQDYGKVQIVPSKRVIIKEGQLFENFNKKEVSPSVRIKNNDYIKFYNENKNEVSPSTRINIQSLSSFFDFGKNQSSPGTRFLVEDILSFSNFSLLKSSPSKVIMVYSNAGLEDFTILRSSSSIRSKISHSLDLSLFGTGTQSKTIPIKTFENIANINFNKIKISPSQNTTANHLIKSSLNSKIIISSSENLRQQSVIKSEPKSLLIKDLAYSMKPKSIIKSNLITKYEQLEPINLPFNKVITSNSMTVGMASYPSLSDFINTFLFNEYFKINLQNRVLTKGINLLEIKNFLKLINLQTSVIKIDVSFLLNNYFNFIISNKKEIITKIKEEIIDKATFFQRKSLYINNFINNQLLFFNQLNISKQHSNYCFNNNSYLNSNSILSFSDAWQYPIYRDTNKLLFISQAYDLSYIEENKTLVII